MLSERRKGEDKRDNRPRLIGLLPMIPQAAQKNQYTHGKSGVIRITVTDACILSPSIRVSHSRFAFSCRWVGGGNRSPA